jgi:hypothetical protein
VSRFVLENRSDFSVSDNVIDGFWDTMSDHDCRAFAAKFQLFLRNDTGTVPIALGDLTFILPPASGERRTRILKN